LPIKDTEFKYSTDYMTLKFAPPIAGGYIASFFNRNNNQLVASSPYKLIVHDELKPIIKSSGIYDLTRLSISSSHLPDDYSLSQFNVHIYGNLIDFFLFFCKYDLP
jgi:hypothetical protein